MTGVIAVDDPRRPDVRALLELHLALMLSATPPEHAFALDVDGLLDPAITFCSLRADGELLGVGALKRLDAAHAEIKSMHTAQHARGRGVGRAMLGHLLGLARSGGYRRVSLETGTVPEFAAARALYASAGFADCGPFAGYQPSEDNCFMTLALEQADNMGLRPRGLFGRHGQEFGRVSLAEFGVFKPGKHAG